MTRDLLSRKRDIEDRLSTIDRQINALLHHGSNLHPDKKKELSKLKNERDKLTQDITSVNRHIRHMRLIDAANKRGILESK